MFRTLLSGPWLSEQFLRHRLLQSLPDPSRSNHGELSKTLFGNSEPAALLQNLRISLIKCRSDNPKRDLLAALRFIYVFALGSDSAIAPAVGVAYGFDVALSAIGWLLPLGYSAAHWLVLARRTP